MRGDNNALRNSIANGTTFSFQAGATTDDCLMVVEHEQTNLRRTNKQAKFLSNLYFIQEYKIGDIIRQECDAYALKRVPCFVNISAQVLKFAQEAAGEGFWNVIPKMVSKSPRGSNSTSQQIGQIAISIDSAE